jgi:hypothetical protein
MKTAAIYLSKKEIFVHSYAKAKAGFSIATEPFFKFDRNIGHTDLVRAIKSALEVIKKMWPILILLN